MTTAAKNTEDQAILDSMGIAGGGKEYIKARQGWDGTRDAIQGIQKAQVDTAALDSAQYLERTAKQAGNSMIENEYQASKMREQGGWTGSAGYVADTQTNLNYLRESIQADMYNQFELQKAGYKANLASARANAELQLDKLALEEYNASMSQALDLARMSDFFLPPHLNDMVQQHSMAAQALEANPDDERAQSIIKYVKEAFHGYGVPISEAGIRQLGVEVNALSRLESINASMATDLALEKTAEERDYIIPKRSETGTIIGYDLSFPKADDKESWDNLVAYYDSTPAHYEKTYKWALHSLAPAYEKYLEANDAENTIEVWNAFIESDSVKSTAAALFFKNTESVASTHNTAANIIREQEEIADAGDDDDNDDPASAVIDTGINVELRHNVGTNTTISYDDNTYEIRVPSWTFGARKEEGTRAFDKLFPHGTALEPGKTYYVNGKLYYYDHFRENDKFGLFAMELKPVRGKQSHYDNLIKAIKGE